MKPAYLFIISLCFIWFLCIILNNVSTKIDISTYYCFDTNLRKKHNTQSIPSVFKKTNIIPVDTFSKADIIFTFNHDQFHKLSSLCETKAKYIYGLRCVNLLASKSTMALIIRSRCPSIIPKTWILKRRLDLVDLRKHFSQSLPTKQLLLKSNRQRQSGLKLVTHINDINNDLPDGSSHEYVVCQEIVSNPLLISNRRIAIRVYMLIVCDQSQSKCFIYNDGFIYYTPQYNSTTHNNYDNTITSGYVDRDVYVDNPLTLQDMYKNVGTYNSSLLKENIKHCFTKMYSCYKPYIDLNDVNDGTNRFIILGADVIPTDNYDVKLLEINKGPDLTFKDVRDEELKTNLVKDTLHILRNPSRKSEHFIRLCN